MTLAVYKQILKFHQYRDKAKGIVTFDGVIDHLISKDIIDESEYMKIWGSRRNRIDELFHILNTKSYHTITKCFNIFQSIYGQKFTTLLKEIKQEILNYVHLKGGFPKINDYVERAEEEAKIKRGFANITWDNSLVVYGRVGEGKSFLVCECLKDLELTWEHFDHKLFWINAGECENGSNILQPLTRLLQMVTQKKGKIDDLNNLIEELQTIFTSRKYMKSLVILDNARSLEVIEIFQRIKCKLIIITHYKTVQHSEFIEIKSGFTLNETISLFAHYLETTTENLCNLFLDDIKDIHELCKGHPSTLALLGVILKFKQKHALASKELWDYIKEKIDKGEIDHLGNDADIIQSNFHNALKMCIDTIETDEMRELYYRFAVFPKDANISSEVLQVFWGKTPEQVSEIMLHFENRSLVNSFYNEKKKAYIYVIHDLFLYYLKNETRNRKKEFHQKLVTTYADRYEFHLLPDDNYILLFLGYHLKQAELIDMFERFLDLRFIDHKIRIVGVNNMEQDLKMYRDEIINGDPDLREKLETCLRFIRDNKNELRQPLKTDIVQLALPTLKDDAQKLMITNQANSINKLYLTMKLSAGRLKSSHELFMQEKVTAMAFCTDSNVSKILIGFDNGDVSLYCSQTTREFDRFKGHKSFISDLKVSNDNSYFLSVSNDRTVKLWQFFSQRLSLDGINDVPTSPKCVQNEYFHVLSPSKVNNYKEFTYNEDNTYLISANFSNNFSQKRLICTGTSSGKVILWNTNNKEKLYMTTETGFPVENIYFSYDDSSIIFTKQEKIQIYKYEKDELHYFESIHNVEDIVKLFVPNENTLIAIGSKSVMMYKLPYVDDSRIKVYESTTLPITCSAVAKGEYFTIGVKEKVLLFDVSNGRLVGPLEHNKIVTSIAMDLSKDDDNTTSMIMMNFNDNYLQQCNIMMEHYGQPRHKQSLVTTYWKNKDVPMLAVVSNDKILKIQHEFNTITEIEKPHTITFITFSLNGNNIIFALENGHVLEYQYKRQGSFKTLMNLGRNVNYLQCLDLNSITEGSMIGSNSFDSENGAIVAITNNIIYILFDNGKLTNFSWEFTINHVFLMASQRLLCVDGLGGIFIMNNTDHPKRVDLVKYAYTYRKVNAAAYCSKNNLLAIAYTKQDLKTNHLDIIDINTKLELRSLYLDFNPKCCTFSHHGDLLVLGGEDGKLIVCNVRDDFKCKTLSMSGSSVNFVQFSKSETPILIAIGREVSWWNLSNVETNTTNSSYSNGDFDHRFWKSKTFHDDIPYLLQTVSLYGDAVHFSVSKNFETFLVVDDESRTYLMKCFKNII